MRKFAGRDSCDKYQLCEDARTPNLHLSEQPIIPNDALFAVYKSFNRQNAALIRRGSAQWNLTKLSITFSTPRT